MAENLISAELLDSYMTYTTECLEKLDRLMESLEESPKNNIQARKDIFAICHDIKGMGGSFNYPLMTEAGASICNYLRNLEDKNQIDQKLVQAHITSMHTIIENKITGSGDNSGEELINRLNELVEHSLA